MAGPDPPTGTDVNSDDAAEKPRIARPSASISSVPKPASARTDRSMADVTSRNFIGFSSDTGAGGLVDEGCEELLLALHPAQVGRAVDMA